MMRRSQVHSFSAELFRWRELQLQAYPLTVFHRCCDFLQVEDRILHQQKDYYSLCCGGLELNPHIL